MISPSTSLSRPSPPRRSPESCRCVLQLARALSATSRVMRGDASYSRWERPFAMILGCLDISVARSTRCVQRLCRALSSPSPRGLSRPPDLGVFLEKCRKSDVKSAHVHQNAREAARFHRTHHLHIALSILSCHYDFRFFMCGLNTVRWRGLNTSG